MKKVFGGFWIFCTAFALLSSAIIFHPAAAQAEDLIQLYRLAIDKDPQYKGAGFERLAQQESLKQAYAALWPNVDFESNITETRQDVVSSENQVFAHGASTYLSTTFGPTLTVPLFRFPLLVQLRQKKQVFKQADVDFELAKQDLIIRLAKAYVAAQTAADNIAYVKEEKKDVEAFVERADSRYKSGLAPNTDIYDAKARLASVEANLVKSENEYQNALQALATMTGQPVLRADRFKEDLPLVAPDPTGVEEWTNAGLEKSLQMKSRRFETETARQEINLQKAAHLPTLNMVSQFNQNNMGGSLYGGGATVDTGDVAFNIDVPIFEGGATRSKTREAKYRYMESMQALEQQKRDVVLQVSTAFSGVKTAISRANALKESIHAQTELYDAKELGYRSGVYTSLAVLDAARDLYLYRRDFSLSRYDYVMNTLELKKAVGTLSEDDLIVINGWLAR
ncbi:MAG: TolC family outer membrane protein [Terracidiphilus sp.]